MVLSPISCQGWTRVGGEGPVSLSFSLLQLFLSASASLALSWVLSYQPLGQTPE